MVRTTLEWLSGLIQASPLIAILGAFLWGVLSILLSPCHLSTIPLIVGFISGQGEITNRRAFFLSFLFALGGLSTIALIGVVTGVSGKMLGDIGPYGNYIVAVVFFIVGLYLIEVISLPFLGKVGGHKVKKGGAGAAFVLGLLFGIGLGPCTFAYMAPMLAIVFAMGSSRLLHGLFLLLVYAVGHCAVIVGAGSLTEVVQHYLNCAAKSNTVGVVKKVCGALVILGGIYLIWSA
ncbi:MAG: cytochrome c biogenesis protein CcdA [candidate division WOR-3 bacterium]|nr:cytochrome c biogenesis protein CcdA [candidate division WOR-3 bacterium]